MPSAEDLKTPITIVREYGDYLRNASANSLSEVAPSTRLASITVIEDKLSELARDEIEPLLQTALTIYCSDYIRAFNYQMLPVKSKGLLDSLATHRDLLNNVGNSAWDTESLTSFPTPENWNLESMVADVESLTGDDGLDTEATDEVNQSASVGRQIEKIGDSVNLAVGKTFELKIQSEDAKCQLTIPVTATLKPRTTSTQSFIDSTTYSYKDKTMVGRWHQMRTGEISVVRDWIFKMDLVDADAKALRADETGNFGNARSKRYKNIVNSIASKRGNMNNMSSIFIVSKGTAREMERAIGGKFKKPKTVREFFKNNVACMLIVVDLQNERFNLYQRGIEDYGTYTFEDIKDRATKNNSNDIEAALKAYKMGQAPEF